MKEIVVKSQAPENENLKVFQEASRDAGNSFFDDIFIGLMSTKVDAETWEQCVNRTKKYFLELRKAQ